MENNKNKPIARKGQTLILKDGSMWLVENVIDKQLIENKFLQSLMCGCYYDLKGKHDEVIIGESKLIKALQRWDSKKRLVYIRKIEEYMALNKQTISKTMLDIGINRNVFWRLKKRPTSVESQVKIEYFFDG